MIRLGENNIANFIDCDSSVCAPPPQDRRPLQFTLHPNYNHLTTDNDIALIQVEIPVEFHSRLIFYFQQRA